MPTSTQSLHGLKIRKVRAVSWLSAARKAFDLFPKDAREICVDALTLAAERGKASIAKPLKGLGPGIFEIALPYQGNAWRVMYAVQIGEDIWVVHAFQKKSKAGIKTPQQEIDLVENRLKRLREILK
ncbi:MAG: type II toxin-antitoxin system RelE/ParE family toxin [Betaproteobacteria bacterium]|nr:type II toxin-antitoxin system RelE/ParE family toxin [Betaproteobacteria bacterium]